MIYLFHQTVHKYESLITELPYHSNILLITIVLTVDGVI